MALFPLSDLLTTLSDNITKALRVRGEVKIDQTTPGTTNAVVVTGNLPKLRVVDPATGNPVEVTAIQDGSGDWVLRIVDASPYTGSKKAIPVVSTLSQTVNVLASGTQTFTITPPAGELWRVKLLGVDVPIPAGGASGTQLIQLFYSNASSALNTIADITSVYSAKVVVRGNIPLTKSSCTPPTDGDFADQIRSIAITTDNPLLIVYSNLTNVSQTGTIGIKLVKEIEYIG